MHVTKPTEATHFPPPSYYPVRFAGLSAGAGLFSLWLQCTVRGDAPQRYSALEGETPPALAFVPAEQGDNCWRCSQIRCQCLLQIFAISR